DDVISGRGNGTNNSAFIYFQRYTSAGRANGSQVTVVQSRVFMSLRSLAMNSAGQFVETWSNYYSSLPSYAQVYTSAGSPTGSVVKVAPNRAITTAMDTAGNVTFAWTGDSSTIGNSNYLYAAGDVFYRQLTAAGQLRPVSIANTTTQGPQTAAGV